MAKRWTVSEAYAALKSGDRDAREDIGRRFPLFATATPEEILGAISNITARQVEARLRSEDEEEEEERPKKSRSEKKVKKEKGSKKPKVVEEDDEDDDDFLDDFLDDDEDEE